MNECTCGTPERPAINYVYEIEKQNNVILSLRKELEGVYKINQTLIQEKQALRFAVVKLALKL
jgi:hypothetical protein